MLAYKTKYWIMFLLEALLSEVCPLDEFGKWSNFYEQGLDKAHVVGSSADVKYQWISDLSAWDEQICIRLWLYSFHNYAMPWQAFFDQLITISGVKNQEGGLLVTPKPRKKTFLNPQTSCICTGTLKRWRRGESKVSARKRSVFALKLGQIKIH